LFPHDFANVFGLVLSRQGMPAGYFLLACLILSRRYTESGMVSVGNAASIIVKLLNQGLTDLANSYYHVNPDVLVALDGLKVLLDFFGIIVNLVTIYQNLSKAVEFVGASVTFGRALLAPVAGTVAGNAVKLAWANLGSALFGGFNLWGDIINFRRAQANADAQ
jgi:hypothetical protein